MKSSEYSGQPLKVCLMRAGAQMPLRATEGAAGLDLCAAMEEEVVLLPGEPVKIPTGVSVELPATTVGLVFGRSGMGVRYGVTLSNGVGVIDCDYRGEIFVGLINHTKVPYTVLPGARLAQLVVVPVCRLPLVQVDTLSETERGEGGFGSTGV